MSYLHPGLDPGPNEISLSSKLSSKPFVGMLAGHLLLQGTISLRNQLLDLGDGENWLLWGTTVTMVYTGMCNEHFPASQVSTFSFTKTATAWFSWWEYVRVISRYLFPFIEKLLNCDSAVGVDDVDLDPVTLGYLLHLILYSHDGLPFCICLW